MIVPSTDGVQIAVHDLDGAGAALLVSHATGFHGRCYQPLADALPTRHCIAFDYRGHGDTPLPEGLVLPDGTMRPGETLDWQQYGDDAVAMAEWTADQYGGPIEAFGHSMGAACLLIAAHRRPELFRRIVAFEPIVFPPSIVSVNPDDSTMVQGARRRRSSFPSYAAAFDNFAAKRPLSTFTPAALDAYVRYGFREGEDGQVHLKCTTETEALTFAGGPTHDTWDHLPAITTEVLVIAGQIEPMQPSAIAAQIAERLANATYLQLDELDHFGPMTHPVEIAALLSEAFA